MSKKNFDIEYQYQFYLKKVKLEESKMHSVQKTKLRETFFAACGQMLLLMSQDLSELEEDKAIEELDNMLKQVQDFWDETLKSQ